MSDETPPDRRTVRLSVPEMDCASCASTVGDALEGVDGPVEYETLPGAGRVSATFDPDRTTEDEITGAIEGAGYEVRDTSADADGSPHDVWSTPRAIKTWIGAGLLIVGLVFEFGIADPTLATVLDRTITPAWLALVGAAVVAGGPIARNGYASLRNRRLDIDLLMAAGVIGALLVNLPFEAATLAVLFNVAELLEHFSVDRTRNSLRELMELSPDTATVRRDTGSSETPRADGEAVDGEEVTVPVEAVEVGEVALVRPGETVPLDGVVREGRSAVDESPVTGESVPVDKAPGAEVYAGSVNEEGYLEIEVTASAENSTLSRVVRLVEEAERGETSYERFVDRFARYYTPIILAGAVLTTLLSPSAFGVSWTEAFTRGLTLLVISCPCALVISTPVSVVSGVTSAARNGVLIKGGEYLEAMSDVETVAVDKTGTLTTGELSVTDVVPLGDRSETDFLACARAIEQRSEHPIADAIVAFAEERGVPDRTVSDFEAIPGVGARADLDGRTHYAGKPALFEELGFDLEHAHVETDGGLAAEECEHGAYVDLLNETVPRLQAEGKSVVLVGTDAELEGVIAVADTLRPDAPAVVADLQALGLDVVMLTGDNDRTARAIGGAVGVDDVRADLLPDEKVAAIQELREQGPVAMVGDGVNDAPALAAADVGIAMGAAGTDTAIETADVGLMGDDLTRLPYLRRLATRANRTIRSNIWASLGVKAVLAVGAPLGLVSVVVAIVVGDMGMSLAVTGNAMRLARVSAD